MSCSTNNRDGLSEGWVVELGSNLLIEIRRLSRKIMLLTQKGPRHFHDNDLVR